MTDHEVALIVRDARSSGFVQAEDDFFPYIRSRGVTVEDYTRYERGRTVRWCVFCVVVAVAVSAWSIYVTWRAGR